jgi:hypothetical protein
LLVQTEALTTSPWSTSGSSGTQGTGVVPVITPNQLAPDGSMTAWRLQFDCGGGTTAGDRSGVSQPITGLPLSIHSTQIYVKPLDGTTGSQLANFDLFSALVAQGPRINNTATAQSDGWFLLTRNQTPAVVNGDYRLQISGNQQQTLDVLVWRPQLELGSTATAYQRVTTAFDVTESGQRDCFGVRADGIDDGYQTAGNVDFSGTPRVTVFAAVRKLSDANAGIIAKLGTLTTQPGTFQLLGPGSAAANNYTATSIGDGTFRAVSASGLASPNTSIVTGISDISAPLIRIRVNGVVQGETNLSQGSGNYANDILTLFSRNNADRFFNGNLYALIVAGGSYPLSTIQRVERLLSRITPMVNL